MSRAVLTTRLAWALALISLIWGVWRSLQPDALVDLHRVALWAGEQAGGVSPYGSGSETDYPPWALVLLTPLAVVPEWWRGVVWVSLNLAMAVGVSVALAREPTVPRKQRHLATAILLAASCFRVLSQFSLLAFALAWAGARDRSAWRGGVWLGLALLKPHVGGPLWLAHVCWRDWTRVTVAAAVPVTLTLVASVWTGMSPAGLIADYGRALEFAQGGADPFSGHTELEPWIAAWWPAVTSLAGTAAVALILAAPLLWRAWREGARRPIDVRRELMWYAWWGLVSLLSVRHLSYDFLLLLPLVVAWWPGGRGDRWTNAGRVAWGTTVILLVAQLPGWWRRLFEPMGVWSLGEVVVQLDRVLCIGLYGAILWVFIRLDVTK